MTFVAQAIGAQPRSVTVSRDEGKTNFLEIDGISSQWAWIDSKTTSTVCIADWRNAPWVLSAVLHDGRRLGGMNAFNINAAAAPGLSFLTLSGVALAWRRRKNRLAERLDVIPFLNR